MTDFLYIPKLDNEFDFGKYSTDSIIRKIESYSHLPDGWDFGLGTAPSQNVVQKSIQLYLIGVCAFGFEGDARPDPEGNIIVSFFRDDDFLFITVKETDTFDFVHEKGIGSEYDILAQKEDVSLQDIYQIIKTIKKRWFLLELYTSADIMPQARDSQAIYSRTSGMESLYSKSNVQDSQVMAPFVYI